MAQVVLEQALEAAGLGDLAVVDSTGISSEEQGNPIDWRAARVLRRAGYAVDDTHRARRITAPEFNEQDLVLPMTYGHYRALDRLRDGGDTEVRMLREFDPAVVGRGDDTPSSRLDIDDPWYGGEEDFERTLEQVRQAADGVVQWVRDRA
jgi:protein-tyrosine phosphatase